MKKVFAYILVNLFTWNPDKSKELVEEFFEGESCSFFGVYPEPKVVKEEEDIYRDYLLGKVQFEDLKPKKKTKRDEVLESLSYLRSKPSPTKQDRESIYTLEMVLKNMA